MRLEDEIKTKAFRTQRQKLYVNLIYSSNWLQSKASKTFAAHGITAQQYNILRILRGQFPNPCNIQLLRDRMLDKQPDVSRLIDRLVQKDLASRNVSANDRRKMDVLISEKGLELLAEMQADIDAFENLAKNLSEDEVEMLNDLLDKLRD